MRVTATALTLLLLCWTPTAACPFCSAIPGFTTVQRVFAENPQIVVARPRPDGDGGISHLVVVDVLQGGATVGRRIDIVEPIPFGEARTYLVLAATPDFAKPRTRPLDKENEAFLRGVAALPPRTSTDPAERDRRLGFFLDHLGRPNRLVAASVSEEFANADYGTMKALRARLDLDRLVASVESREGFALHRGLAYLLVGLIGTNEAGRHLGRWLGDAEHRARPGLDGLLGAWLLVRGEVGFATVRALRPAADAPRQARRWYVRSLVNALDFHAVYETRIPRPAVLEETVALLDDPEAGAPAIELLEKLAAWERRTDVEKALGRAAAEHGEFHRTGRRFLERCRMADESPEPPIKR